jgi:ApbE family
VLAPADRFEASLSNHQADSPFSRGDGVTWASCPAGSGGPGLGATLVRTVTCGVQPVPRCADPPLAARRGGAGDRRTVDVQAIAKGWIIDQMVTAGWRVEGVSAVRVDPGGDVRRAGNAGSAPVTVAVADPSTNADNVAPLAMAHLGDGAVASIGHPSPAPAYPGDFPNSGCPDRAEHVCRVLQGDVRIPRPISGDVRPAGASSKCRSSERRDLRKRSCRPATTGSLGTLKRIMSRRWSPMTGRGWLPSDLASVCRGERGHAAVTASLLAAVGAWVVFRPSVARSCRPLFRWGGAPATVSPGREARGRGPVRGRQPDLTSSEQSQIRSPLPSRLMSRQRSSPVDLDPLFDRGDAVRASSPSAGRHDDALDERCDDEPLVLD